MIRGLEEEEEEIELTIRATLQRIPSMDEEDSWWAANVTMLGARGAAARGIGDSPGAALCNAIEKINTKVWPTPH